MRIVRTALLAVAGGLLIASVLFMLTSPPDVKHVLSVGGVITQTGYIDFWTGEITPRIVTVHDFGSGKSASVYVTPEDYQDYRVIPLPVGFVVGSLLTLTVITIAARRPRENTPDPAVLAA